MKATDHKSGLTHEALTLLLHYNPETGVFTRRASRGRGKAGTEVGTVCRGYKIVPIEGRNYLAHRLAWFYMTGEWPLEEVDHKNLDKGDNSWANLRHASRADNVHNRPASKRRHGGPKGATPASLSSGKWRARISIGGVQRWLGVFDTAEDAGAAYAKAAQAIHGEFARS